MHRTLAALALGLAVFALVGGAFLVHAAPVEARGAAPAESARDRIVEGEKNKQDAVLQRALNASKGNSKAFLGQVAGIVASYRKAKLAQGSALSRYLYGRVLFKQFDFEMQVASRQARARKLDRRKADEAVAEMHAALQRDPQLWQARYALAFIHLTLGETKLLEAVLSQLLRTQGHRVQVIAMHAQLLYQKRRWKELKAVASKLLSKNLDNLGARRLLVFAHMGLEEWAKAEQAVLSMLARIPADKSALGLRLEVFEMLAECLIQQSKFEAAENKVIELITRYPQEVRLRFLLAKVRQASGNLKGAIQVVKQVTDTPKYKNHVPYLIQLSELYGIDKQLPKAEAVLHRALALCLGTDQTNQSYRVMVLTRLGRVLYLQERWKAALVQYEALDRMMKGNLPPHILDFMQNCYGNLGRTKDLIRTLERLLPHMKGRPANRKKLEDLIKRLKAGGQPGTQPGTQPARGEGELWGGRDLLAELIEKIGSRDVKERREGLFIYYQANLPFVDPVVYLRHSPSVEPDPECRLWVVKILSRFNIEEANPEIVRLSSRYVGLCLEDPDQDVRRAAAEGLQRIGSPVAILYLMPYLGYMELDPSQLTESGRKLREKEYNAARTALRQLTGREDTRIGDEPWVLLAQAPEHRKGWMVWYDSEKAVAVRLKALDALDLVDKVGPRWALRYVLSDLVKKPIPLGNGGKRRTTPTRVYLRTYRLMKSHVLRYKTSRPEEFAKDGAFSSFPVYKDEDITEANIPAMRTSIIKWYASVKGMI